MTGIFTVSGGVANTVSNLAAPFSITTGASPFSWTNNTGIDVDLYLDANGATTTAAKNGTTIFTSLVAGDHTIHLHPNQWATITYSVATPIITAAP